MKSKSWAAIGIILLGIFTLTACSKGDSASNAAAPASYSISGTATINGVALQGVSITLSGAGSATTATDTSGNYAFANLSAGSYTVTPSLAGYTYSPSSTTVNITDANQSQNFTAAPVSYSISGTATVDGIALQGVTITLSGASSATTATNASGNYTFANLSAGSYTVTPSLAGYTYSPSSPTINITDANQSQNFTAASVVASYSISGTISYSGSHTGRIYVGLKNANGSATGHGTSIASPGAFVIHGVTPGTYYKLSAEMDIRNDGTLNADNPSGEILTITVTGASLTNQNITLTDPVSAAPVTPTGLRINPGDGVALICWNNMTSNYKTIAESYKIYWGTDTAATSGTPIIVQASHNMYLQSIAYGNYYFKISAIA
ncbi:MAG: carboxypeptidase regulatory-like domain-containing protein, partial [Smithella sp.]